MVDIRDTQIQLAQQNPNILSPLVGAPTQTELQSQAQTAATPEEAAAKARQLGTQYGQQLYQQGPLPGIGQNIQDMTRQLFEYDQKLEQGQTPYPQLPWFTPNPADIYQGAAGFAGMQGRTIGLAQNAQESIANAYLGAVNNIVDRFLNFYQMAESRRREESDKEKEDLDTAITLTKLQGGGEIEWKGKKYNIQGERDQQEKGITITHPDGSVALVDPFTGEVKKKYESAPLFPGTTETNESKPTTKPAINRPQMAGPPYSPKGPGIVENYGGQRWVSTAKGTWIAFRPMGREAPLPIAQFTRPIVSGASAQLR